MAESSIPVDLLNPGQVFACLGFLEAANELIGNAQGGFNWSNSAHPTFVLKVQGHDNPVDVVLSFLANAQVTSLAPPASVSTDLATENWNVPTQRISTEGAFPIPLPTSPATLPAILTNNESKKRLMIDYWGDSKSNTSRDNAKFWAGGGGYPGAALTRDGLQLIRNCDESAKHAPFDFAADQSSSFRFDWRRDYIPLDIGFSLNNHANNRFSPVGYPFVEILAAIGLTNARPEFVSKLEYRYSVIGSDRHPCYFDPMFVRAALGGANLPFPQRRFNMKLGWPGKEGQARCITTVTEELCQ